MTPGELVLGLVLALGAGAGLVAVAGLLTVATFTSIRDSLRRPISTLPTEPIDLRAVPRGRHRITARTTARLLSPAGGP